MVEKAIINVSNGKVKFDDSVKLFIVNKKDKLVGLIQTYDDENTALILANMTFLINAITRKVDLCMNDLTLEDYKLMNMIFNKCESCKYKKALNEYVDLCLELDKELRKGKKPKKI